MNKSEIPLSTRRHPLVATVQNVIRNRDVVIGVSGGVDSTALLILTEELCQRFGVPCYSKKVCVQPLNSSIAAGARQSRYMAMEQIAKKVKSKTVLTAHHASDQLETIIMALCRGGGMGQLSGMASERILAGNISLVRPLLNIDKKILEHICHACGVKWCEDATNLDCKTPRGKLRKEILPLLRDLYPAADRHAANASTLLKELTNILNHRTDNGTAWKRKELAEKPALIISNTIHQALGTHATFETIQSITSAGKDDITEPRVFTCASGCIATVTAHEVAVTYA